jgi:single-stranded DNA-binding protein
MIDCAFFGFLAADAERKISQAGKLWARLRIGVGKDEGVQWVSVAVFGKAAEAAGELRKGDRCYIEGAIRLNTWRGNDGVDRHELSVAAFKCDQTHQIGRNRPKRERQRAAPRTSPPQAGDDELNDAIPF